MSCIFQRLRHLAVDTNTTKMYTTCHCFGDKIKSYVVSEFTECLCDFQDTSLTCTNKRKVEAVMVNVFVFCEIPRYVVCSLGDQVRTHIFVPAYVSSSYAVPETSRDLTCQTCLF